MLQGHLCSSLFVHIDTGGGNAGEKTLLAFSFSGKYVSRNVKVIRLYIGHMLLSLLTVSPGFSETGIYGRYDPHVLYGIHDHYTGIFLFINCYYCGIYIHIR